MNHYSFDEIEIGHEEKFHIKITADMLESFTKLTGDVNPIHLSDEYAQSYGFDHKLVYGMLTASFYSTLVGVYLPGEYCLFQECNTTFNAPVFVGDELTIFGKVIEKHEGFKRIKIKAFIKNQENKKVSRALLIVGVNK